MAEVFSVNKDTECPICFPLWLQVGKGLPKWNRRARGVSSGGPPSWPTRIRMLQMAGQSSSHVRGLFRHYREILEIYECMHTHIHTCMYFLLTGKCGQSQRDKESVGSERWLWNLAHGWHEQGHDGFMFSSFLNLNGPSSWYGSRSVWVAILLSSILIPRLVT